MRVQVIPDLLQHRGEPQLQHPARGTQPAPPRPEPSETTPAIRAFNATVRWNGNRHYVPMKSAPCSSCPADLACPWSCVTQPDVARCIFGKQRAPTAAASPEQHMASGCRLSGKRDGKDMAPQFYIFCSIFKRITYQKADKTGSLSRIVRSCIHQSDQGSASFSCCAGGSRG